MMVKPLNYRKAAIHILSYVGDGKRPMYFYLKDKSAEGMEYAITLLNKALEVVLSATEKTDESAVKKYIYLISNELFMRDAFSKVVPSELVTLLYWLIKAYRV